MHDLNFKTILCIKITLMFALAHPWMEIFCLDADEYISLQASILQKPSI